MATALAGLGTALLISPMLTFVVLCVLVAGAAALARRISRERRRRG